jgi:chemotaxis signal transduction protein
MEATPWLCFEVSGQDYAVPLASVVEVTGAQRPHLIPRIPLEIGGVLNVRGEPLPAVDGGALLTGSKSGRHKHVLVLERGSLRIGVLVGQVRRIERALPAVLSEESDSSGTLVALVQWVDQEGGALGLVDPEGLIERATMLLTDQRKQPGGQESWHNGF